MDCLENAGRLNSADYQRSVLHTTLSPCPLCSGAVLHYRIPRVVIGEIVNFIGAEDLLRQNRVELNIFNDPKCASLMSEFLRASPELWHEDMGTEISLEQNLSWFDYKVNNLTEG